MAGLREGEHIYHPVVDKCHELGMNHGVDNCRRDDDHHDEDGVFVDWVLENYEIKKTTVENVCVHF